METSERNDGPTGGPLLVAGATGFVGRALVARLTAEGATVRAIARDPTRAAGILPKGVELRSGDLVDGRGLAEALAGVRTAYYLVHSMGVGAGRSFAALDRAAAEHFVAAAGAAGVDRIIYLGGLGEESPGSSEHLESRREVGRILRSGSAPVTQLRAGIVVGAGGSSFEMMVQLVEHLPVMICPRWIDRRCQPIALPDLVRYLAECRSVAATRGRTFDVGGPDVLPYGEMLQRVGAALGRRPCLVVLPRFTPSLSAHWVGYITDVPAGVARPIIDGMSVDAICRESALRELLPGPVQGFDAALRLALADRARAGRPPSLLGGRIARPFEGRSFRLGGPRSAAVPAERAGGHPAR